MLLPDYFSILIKNSPMQDSDVWTNNLPYMNATFARAEYADAIPIEGRVIQVAVPPVDPDRDGGVGLDDLEAYLDPKARAEQLEKLSQGEEEQHDDKNSEKMSIMMDVKIERTGTFLNSPACPDFMPPFPHKACVIPPHL